MLRLSRGLPRTTQQRALSIVGAGLVAVLVVAGMIVLINRRAYKRIEELENA
jgi:hypothetical protein